MKTLMQSTAVPVTGAMASTIKLDMDLIKADSALQSFSNGSPLIDTFYLADDTRTPGTQPVTVVVKGEYISSRCFCHFQV